MDHSITALSPRTTPRRQELGCRSPMMYRTPRSEGFLKHKVILDTPTSSEFSFSTRTVDDNTELTPNSSADDNGSKHINISEKKFYSKNSRNLLSLFVKSQTHLANKEVAGGQQIDNKTPKRKRSKSVEYRNRNKIVKLNKNIRHGIKKPKPKKAPVKTVTVSSQKNPIPDTSIAPGKLSVTSSGTSQVSEGSESVFSSLLVSNIEDKQKERKKEISVKVNKLVRMNLQCGEIKFTKSSFSPKKIPTKIPSGTFDVLDETDDWLKGKVDNILNSLGDDDEMEISLDNTGMGRSLDSSHVEDKLSCKLNDLSEPLRNGFHEHDVKDIMDSDNTKKSDGSISFGNKEVHEKGKESSILFEDTMEVADENTTCHDVLSEKAVHSNEGNFITPNRKLFPVFYKSSPGNSKENLVNSKKSVKESCKITPSKILDGMEQLIIDAGQKSLAPTTCHECGFFYQKGDADEEKMHKMYHGSGKPGIKHLGWKWERVAVKFPEGRVIRVCTGDPKTWWNKVDNVLEKANDDLGITFSSKLPKNSQAYMFVGDGYILGCVIAEPIRVAYRMLESDRKEVENVEINEKNSFEIPKVPSFCSNTPVRGGRCGINRMWTCASERRKGIATKILDAIRATFVYGRILQLNELAFSDPTPLGMSFAQKYTKTANFLVYKPTYD